MPGREELRRRVLGAFASVSFPGDERLFRSRESGDLERDEIVAWLAGRHWSELTANEILERYEQHGVLANAGFYFLLPAILLALLARETDPEDTVDALDDLIFNLTTPERVYQLERLAPDQLGALRSVLEFVSKEHGVEEDRELSEALRLVARARRKASVTGDRPVS